MLIEVINMLKRVFLTLSVPSLLVAGMPTLQLRGGKLEIKGTYNLVQLETPVVLKRAIRCYSVSFRSSNRYTIYLWNLTSYQTDIDNTDLINLTGDSIDFVDREGYGANFEDKFNLSLYGKFSQTSNEILIHYGEVLGLGRTNKSQIVRFYILKGE